MSVGLKWACENQVLATAVYSILQHLSFQQACFRDFAKGLGDPLLRQAAYSDAAAMAAIDLPGLRLCRVLFGK